MDNYVWTYDVLDYGLIADDPESSSERKIMFVWNTRQLAVEAAEKDYLETFNEDDAMFPGLPRTLDWQNDGEAEVPWNDSLEAKVEGLDLIYRVWPIQLLTE